MAVNGRIKIDNVKLEGNKSVNDPRMGPIKFEACRECEQIDCPGHYGLIDFKLTPIYNPAFIKE